MCAQEQIFGFDRTVTDIVELCLDDQVHIYWKDRMHNYLGCNDIERQLISARVNSENVINKSVFDFMPHHEATRFVDNDKAVIANGIIKPFCEKIFACECVSYKSQLLNSEKKVIGSFGMSFYFDKVTACNAMKIMSKLGLLPTRFSLFLYYFILCKNNLPLTLREKECIYYMAQGMSAKEIGAVLNLSARTVESYINNIKDKLDCYTRHQIISKVFDE